MIYNCIIVGFSTGDCWWLWQGRRKKAAAAAIVVDVRCDRTMNLFGTQKNLDIKKVDLV